MVTADAYTMMNGLQEMCYLPTWPIGFPEMGHPWSHPPSHPQPDPARPDLERPSSFDFRSMDMEGLAEEMRSIIKPEPEEWIRPQPKCVRRVVPYNF